MGDAFPVARAQNRAPLLDGAFGCGPFGSPPPGGPSFASGPCWAGRAVSPRPLTAQGRGELRDQPQRARRRRATDPAGAAVPNPEEWVMAHYPADACSCASVRALSRERRAGPLQPQVQRAWAKLPRSVVVVRCSGAEAWWDTPPRYRAPGAGVTGVGTRSLSGAGGAAGRGWRLGV
ncbi:hypothetical protein GCM10010394_53170 [Streptomyces crystallinus]|uniref:Uncharacterized protein n=1 Tax=Streptomyces crystallinus TaxID=68191 RepID=A0ABP3RSU0_9ACTN